MPTPRRPAVRTEARWQFLLRMYPAAGIHTYRYAGYILERYAPNIQLYSVERLQRILFVGGSGLGDIAYFNVESLRYHMYHAVNYARHRGVVEDWRGIP
ncbi:MAG: hypothetical protein QXP58_07060 [Thermoprotei archaeon]